MEIDERELSAFLRSGSRSGPGTGDCPDELTISSYWDGGLPPDEGARLEEHLALCPSCFSQLGALARLERAAPEPVPAALLRKAKAAGRPRGLSTGALTALAASLLAILGLALWLPTQLDGPPAVRAPILAAAVPEVLHPADGGLLHEGESFRWRAVDGALFYRIRLATDAGDPIWEAEASGVELRLPDGLGLAPGELYFVWVRAHRDDGKTIKSQAVGFRIAGSTSGR